jgi:hypothetical protein
VLASKEHQVSDSHPLLDVHKGAFRGLDGDKGGLAVKAFDTGVLLQGRRRRRGGGSVLWSFRRASKGLGTTTRQ